MFTVNSYFTENYIDFIKFQNISCLRLIKNSFQWKGNIPRFQNISCLRLIYEDFESDIISM